MTSSRLAYRLVLPSNLTAAQSHTWLRAVGGIRSAIGLELHATDRGLTHRLRVLPEHADYVVGQLRSLVPGVRVTPDKQEISSSWTRAVELGLTNPSQPLHLASSEQLATSLLASVQGLKADERMMMQLVIRPTTLEKSSASNEHRPADRRHATSLFGRGRLIPETTPHRGKQDDQTFVAVLRVAVKAASKQRTRHLLRAIRSALMSVGSVRTRFKRKLLVSKDQIVRRIVAARESWFYGARLSVTEISGLMAWPLASPHVAGLPQGRARQLPATAVIPRTGLVLGRSNFPGDERPVALSVKQAVTHLHCLGATGCGKTTLLASLAQQSIQQGHGVIVLESKGDLFNAVLDRVPRGRIKDVIVLDVHDTDHPVGFNVLQTGTARAAVDELSALITGIYGDHGGVYAPMLLYYGLHALAETPGSTFIDLPVMLTPQGPEEIAWRDQVVQNVKNHDVRQFWQRYLAPENKEQSRMTAPVHNRIWQLCVRPELRAILGQSTSRFTFEEVLQENKILLINLGGARIGETTAALTGTLLMNALYSAVRRVKKHKPSFLFLDEFQDFVSLPVNAADMLAKCRSFGLGLVLAHQDLDQLTKVRGLEQAVLANARTKIIWQSGARDARTMQREFGRLVDEDDFSHLGAWETLARIATDDGVSAPITLTANPPSKPVGLANAVRAASRARYGRPIEQVEAEINARRRPTDKPSQKRPKTGPQEWKKEDDVDSE